MSDLAKKGHCQLACARYFEITHNAERDSITINHPNEYFDLTRKLAMKSEGKQSSVFSNLLVSFKINMFSIYLKYVDFSTCQL